MPASNSLPVVLSIAGSDSGGGAGIQADLKTLQAFGCFGTTAITVVTCQNTQGVTGMQAIDVDIVRGQVQSILADLNVKAVKTGMLFSTAIIRAVCRIRKEQALYLPWVVDPVMVASSGDRLLKKEAEQELITFLAYASLITPNLKEAEVILERRIMSFADMRQAVVELYRKIEQMPAKKNASQQCQYSCAS